ncbi:matrixin family metalloprotease [Halorussus sp. AFM4]|uniref:matrixin family metalloprotease n=1 Tax=Halorussus sp. AFM4 TaxID=3421651 RepID=UPI003EBC3F12
MRNSGAVLAAVLVALAGCSGMVQERPETTTAEPTTTSPPAPTASTPAAEIRTTSGAETTARTTTGAAPTGATAAPPPSTTVTTPTADNPWGKATVTVTVDNEANASRNVTPLVRRTLAYWNRNASRYGDYAVRFMLTKSTNADIRLEYVDQIAECGHERDDRTVGCAPVLESGTTAGASETVRIVAGYSNESTLQILRHEFGHVLGIEHGEEPMPTMRALGRYRHLARPNTTERPVPWSDPTLSVHVDASNVSSASRDDVKSQIGHALTYFETGADGRVPDNVTFVRTDNRSAADVRIAFPDDAFDCYGEEMDEGSCGTSWGYDTDVDAAFEYYSEWTVRVRGVDDEAVGWHVGYWLARALGLTDDELPSPFRDATYSERRSDWWADT